jgi:aquaporin Z
MALRATAGSGQSRVADHAVTIDSVLARKAAAELVGTALLVFFGCGVSTISFGFRAFGSSIAAGILVTGLAFGLILVALVATIGPISGCHVNPAVTLGAWLTRRMTIVDAVAYWISQVLGAIIGALLLLWVLHSSPFYTKSRIGLGTNGYDNLSLLRASIGGAFLIEIIITGAFVLVVLAATMKQASVAVSGLVMGLALAVANIVGIPVDGASVNPARSLGPAIVTAGQPLSQVWLFLIAPLIGAVLGAWLHMLLHPESVEASGGTPVLSRFRAQSTASQSAADEGTRPVGTAAGAVPPSWTTPEPEAAPRGSGQTGVSGQPGGSPQAPPGRGSGGKPDDPGSGQVNSGGSGTLLVLR